MENVRIFKSKRDIEQALVSLILEKDFYSIRVHEICQRAMVSRSTFYTHYKDKYDVLEKLTSKTRDYFEKQFEEKYRKQDGDERLEHFLADIYDFYQEKRTILQALLKTPLPPKADFEGDFRKLCQKYVIELLIKDKDKLSIHPELAAALFTSCVFSLMQWMITNGSDQELTRFASQLHSHFLDLIQK